MLTLHHADGGQDEVGASLTLEEARVYHLRHPTASQVWFSERALRRTDDGWVLPIDFWVGKGVLRIADGGSEVRIPVDVLPRTEKLDETAWQAMLLELEAWVAGVTAGLAGGRRGNVTRGLGLPLLTESLLPLIPQFVRNIANVHEHPIRRSRERLEHLPLYRVRAVSSDLVAWLGSNPRAAQHIDPEARPDELLSAPPYVPVYRGYESLDHPANRYVAWLCDRVVRRLDECAEAWRRHASEPDDRGEWARSRSAECYAAAAKVRRAFKQTFLKALQPAPVSEEACLVVTDEPAYARFHHLARLLLSPMFDSSATASCPAPVRETFTLYELWSFIETRRQLATALGQASWQAENLEQLIDPSGTGAGASYRTSLSNGRELLVEFNPTFRSLWARNNSARWSLSKERRPDIVVSARGAGLPPRWVFLDAKYRVKREYLGEAFESVHIYRDSLRDETHGGQCAGGVLLAPRQRADTAAWFSDNFRATHGCGIVRCLPGERNQDVADWILERLQVT